jgi:hypothetical protein
MEDLILSGTEKTPNVSFNYNDGNLELRGRSIPENSLEFYDVIFNWVDNYANDPKSETHLHLKFEYFNTSSSKCILDLMKKLERMHGSKTQAKISWYFESDDEDMQEAGDDYKAIISVPFEVISVDEI